MSVCIELTINDDGSMTVSSEPVETQEEGAETAGTPVKDIEEAIQVIQQMAQEASLAPPAGALEQEGAEMTEEAPADPNAVNPEEEAAMMGGFRGR